MAWIWPSSSSPGDLPVWLWLLRKLAGSQEAPPVDILEQRGAAGAERRRHIGRNKTALVGELHSVGDHGKYKEKQRNQKLAWNARPESMRYTGVSSNKNEAREPGGKWVRYHTTFEGEEANPRAQKWAGHRQLSPWAAANRSNKRKQKGFGQWQRGFKAKVEQLADTRVSITRLIQSPFLHPTAIRSQFSSEWTSSIFYWVDQKLHLGFSVRCYRKTQMKFLASPISGHFPLPHPFPFGPLGFQGPFAFGWYEFGSSWCLNITGSWIIESDLSSSSINRRARVGCFRRDLAFKCGPFMPRSLYRVHIYNWMSPLYASIVRQTY